MQLVDVQKFLDDLHNTFTEYCENHQEADPENMLSEMEVLINGFYTDENIRHKYSSIYQFILNKCYLSENTLYSFLESLKYVSERDNLNEVAKIKFLKLLDHIELENLKIINLYKIDTFTSYYYELDESVRNLKSTEGEILEDFKNTKMELKTIKIDFIGILSSILSLFTIFGLNSSIIPVLIKESQIQFQDKIQIFIGANISLVICIFATLFFIKKLFYDYKLDRIENNKKDNDLNNNNSNPTTHG